MKSPTEQNIPGIPKSPEKGQSNFSKITVPFDSVFQKFRSHGSSRLKQTRALWCQQNLLQCLVTLILPLPQCFAFGKKTERKAPKYIDVSIRVVALLGCFRLPRCSSNYFKYAGIWLWSYLSLLDEKAPNNFCIRKPCALSFLHHSFDQSFSF